MKDYYEVLGVRRHASAGEIELAYKGRRSQYHPDKYATSDQETVRWATDQMQAVNEAYAVLGDATRRAMHDAGGASDTQAAKTGEHAKTDHSHVDQEIPQSLRALLSERLGAKPGFDRTFLAPSIPLKKLSGALGNYGKDLSPDEVVVLIDTTVFGGGKEGILLTETELRIKEIATPLRTVRWREGFEFRVEKQTLYIDSRKEVECPMVEWRELHPVFSLLNELTCPRKPASEFEDASAGASRSKPSAASKSARYAQVLQEAQYGLVNLGKRLAPYEVEHGEAFDRVNAAGYFAFLKEALDDRQREEGAYEELALIANLCAALERICVAREPFDVEGIAAELEDDSQLVAVLISIQK